MLGSHGLLDALPQEAVHRCLEYLRITELAPRLGACSSTLSRRCRQPDLWRREVERCFAEVAAKHVKSGACCWRQVYADALRERWAPQRLALLRKERRLQDLLDEEERRREELASERSGLQQTMAKRKAKLSQFRQEASHLDGWKQSSQDHPGKRAALKKLRDQIQEMKEVERKDTLHLEQIKKKLATSGSSTSGRLALLRQKLADLQSERASCEARLASLPTQATGSKTTSAIQVAGKPGLATRANGTRAAAAAAGERAAAASSTAAALAASRGAAAATRGLQPSGVRRQFQDVSSSPPRGPKKEVFQAKKQRLAFPEEELLHW
eukprot:TRINITY_DN13884_c1_g1_i1.p1 TRINITY_DN13884_c1_g1~~TRINITY_DN13884_c1_g1_i1.p1  ORF type:complete len:325 (-),score=67.27 TRINITY_DN13884_c1_g1_i1:417-1391(-)